MGSSKQHQVYGVGTSSSTSSSNVGAAASASVSHHRGFASGSSSRQQARLGVTTDYLDLSLHSACANGNLGLVQYALHHGQPVNSVLNGVLPLHAAASSGNEQIVRMLIEAGADVNSPRLPRRYSNEKTRASGIAVGTAGSTPLHFAAANGHTAVIELLLQFGAKPSATEKYGLTSEVIAQQKGHLEAAQLLREWAEDGRDDASMKDGQGSSTSLRPSLSKKRLHPRRSLDALAVKLQQHASNPHLLAQHLPHAISATSLHSITAGAGSDGSATSLSRRLSVPNRVKGAHSTRRPSLPSVFEKAAHPSAAIKQALGMTSSKKGSSEASASGRLRKSSSKSSLSSAVWGKDPKRDLNEEDEDMYDSDLETDETDAAETASRRKSEEITRNSKRDSVGSLSSVREGPSTAPPTKTAFHASEYSAGPPPPAGVSRSGSISSASAASFYRPRHSSQLSGKATSSAVASPSTSPRVFIEDEDDHNDSTPRNVTEVSTSTKTLQGKATSPPSALRSPLAAPLHRREGSAASSSQFSINKPSQTPSQTPSGAVTPDSMPGTSRTTSDDGASGSASGRGRSRGESRAAASASRAASVGSRTTTPMEPARRGAGFVVRDRTDSLSSTASSVLSRRHLSNKLAGMSLADPRQRTETTTPPVAEPVVKKAETRTSRSNSAGTDGRFSSSPASSYSGPGTLSTYAPSTNSTTATSVATSKSSPHTSPTPHHHARLPGLSPLYESSSSSLQPTAQARACVPLVSSPITTSAEARSRVKKVEQELLEYDASASSASGASTMKNGQGVGPSLTDKLAAYGQGLALERKLKAIEKGSGGGYRFEMIGTSANNKPGAEDQAGGAPTPSAPLSPKLTVPVPQWRAIPPIDRLMPPAAVAASGRRSVSPVSGLSHPPSSSTTALASPSRKGSREADMPSGITVVPIAVSLHSSSNPSTGPPTRASSPSSSRSSKSQTHTLRVSATAHHHHHHHHHHGHGYTHGHGQHHQHSTTSAMPLPIAHHHQPALLGTGENGISFVEASPQPSSSPSTSHHRGGVPAPSSSLSKQEGPSGGGGGGKSSSQKGGGSVTSVQEQVELDALEQARLAAIVPTAPITVQKHKGGFARRLFGKS